MSDDKRIIEDLIPIEAINSTATGEKVGGRKGHPALLHLWWARRPLAAARAAIYATLVPVDGSSETGRSAEYFRELCRWGASEERIADARQRVLAANGGTPPRVLDMFAGGGAIPLEAARLGCEATAVELNPVAHLIERCMLEYPQRFGPLLADDVRDWGERWIARTWERVGHLYPPIGDLESDAKRLFDDSSRDSAASRAAGRPIAYLWTRTVPCPNPARPPHVVPLVRQTWLACKKGRCVALRPHVDEETLLVEWDVVEATSATELGFDPAAFSKRGHSTCLVCGATVDGNYVKAEGQAGRMGIAPLAAVMVKSGGRGRDYFAAGSYPLPCESDCEAVLTALQVEPPGELLTQDGGRWFQPPLYGLTRFRDIFTPRQLTTLCALAQDAREIHEEMTETIDTERAQAICLALALALDRVVDRSSALCRFDTSNEGLTNTYARQALPMVWDFGESNPFSGASGSISKYVAETAATIEALSQIMGPRQVLRASATVLPLPDASFDAVITDPPYYDNISYADLSDFFYVWLKRSIGFLFPEHLGGELTPKRREAIVAPYRHHGSKDEAREFYEQEMAQAFAEAHRVLKPGAPLVCVYAHKTTLGWSSLVEALRRAGFAITEAWPLDTEMPERSVGQGTSSLASSIFLVARSRTNQTVGEVGEVRAQLDGVIAERLQRLTDAGIAGSDLIIATIGAALQPFTKYASVELPNGEELKAETFLQEVQAHVLNAVLRKVHGFSGDVEAIDAATRYYVLSRYSYGYGKVPFDEANNLARTAGLELQDLRHGPCPLATITKGTVELHDFEARGDNERLGIDSPDGHPRLIDVLHGLLWRASRRTGTLRSYLDEARPDIQRLRAAAQALQGPALRDGGPSKPAEAQACERLLGAWRTLVEDNLLSRT